MFNKKRGYLASGWFNDNDDRILTKLEHDLTTDKYPWTLYRPRTDGIKLSPEEFHDTNLRRSVFLDNVKNIDQSDLVVANLTTDSSPRLDTGTIWEVGYATGIGKRVVLYNESSDTRSAEISLYDNFYDISEDYEIYADYDSLYARISNLLMSKYLVRDRSVYKRDHLYDHPLVLLPSTNSNEYDHLMMYTQEVLGKYVSYATNYSTSPLSSLVSEISKYPYLIIPVGSRNPILIYLMGVAYAMNVPIISYSEDKSSVNLMLLLSTRYHAVGEDLINVLNMVQRSGISSLPEYTGSDLKVY